MTFYDAYSFQKHCKNVKFNSLRFQAADNIKEVIYIDIALNSFKSHNFTFGISIIWDTIIKYTKIYEIFYEHSKTSAIKICISLFPNKVPFP